MHIVLARKSRKSLGGKGSSLLYEKNVVDHTSSC